MSVTSLYLCISYTLFVSKYLDLNEQSTGFKLNTPVGLFFYNRPDLLKTILNQLEAIYIPKLFLVSDGPNSQRFGDREKVRECRNLCKELPNVGETIEIYRDYNVGIYKNITEGIKNIFSNTETCIFLEDDTLPNISFFRYCQELLQWYSEEDKVWLISGTNAFTSKKTTNSGSGSFYFSKYPGFWGWASWSKKWNKYYDGELATYSSFWNQPSFKKQFRSKREYLYWTNKLNVLIATKGTWDTQAIPTSFYYELLSIVPAVNLVTNIGFNHPDATHSLGNSSLANLLSHTFEFPMKIPPRISINQDYDKAVSNYVAPNLLKRLRIGFGRRFRRIRKYSCRPKNINA